MRLLVWMVSIPLAGLSTWWGISSLNDANAGGTTMTFNVARKTFRVTLQEKGELKAANSIDVKSEVGGRSTIISLIPEGSSVKKGDLLVELASDEIEERVQADQIQVASAEASFESAKRQLDILKDQNESNIRKAELKLQLNKLDLEKYTEGEWPQQEEDAGLRVEEAKKVHERQQSNLHYSKELFAKEFITRTELETNEFDCYLAEVNLAKSKRDREILKKYTHVKDLQQKQSDVDEADKELERVKKEADNKVSEKQANLEAREAELKLKQQRLKRLEDQMAKTKILAPADGLVVYGDSNRRWWGNNNQIKEGAEVFERQTILQLPDTSVMKVVVRIHEAQTDKIKIGQEAIVEVEGVSGRRYIGEITKIAVLADSQNRWLNPELKEYETEITLQGTDPLLKPGVTARVELLIAELKDVVAVPVQSVFSKGSKSFVFVGSADDAEPMEVELGLASDEFVEIKSGLEPGRKVLLAVSDLLKTKLPEVNESDALLASGEGSPAAPRAAMKRSGQKRGGGAMRKGGGGRRKGSRKG